MILDCQKNDQVYPKVNISTVLKKLQVFKWQRVKMCSRFIVAVKTLEKREYRSFKGEDLKSYRCFRKAVCKEKESTRWRRRFAKWSTWRPVMLPISIRERSWEVLVGSNCIRMRLFDLLDPFGHRSILRKGKNNYMINILINNLVEMITWTCKVINTFSIS